MPMIVADLIAHLRADATGWKSGMEQAQRSVMETQKVTERATSAVTEGMKTAGLAVGAFVGLAVFQMQKYVSVGIEMNKTLETSTLQFETLFKSAGRAQEHVAMLFDFAKRTPFETGPVIQASRLLQVMGGNALNTERYLTMVGDAAAGASAGFAEVAVWVGRAYSSIQAGRPFGEAAMRLQELGLLSGDARNKLESMQKSGASAADVWNALVTEMDRFSGSMLKQAGTLVGLQSTLKDALGLGTAEAIKPFFDTLKDGTRAAIAFTETTGWQSLIDVTQDWMANALMPAREELWAFIRGAEAFDPKAIIVKIGALAHEFQSLGGVLTGAAIGSSLGALNSIPIIGNLIPGGFGPQMAMAVGSIAGLVASTNEGRAAIAGLSMKFGELADRYGPGVARSLETILDGVTSMIPGVEKLLAMFMDVGAEALDMAASLTASVAPALHLVGDAAGWLGDHEIILKAVIGAWIAWEAAGVFSAIGTAITRLGAMMMSYAATAGAATAATGGLISTLGGPLAIAIGAAAAAYLIFGRRTRETVTANESLVSSLQASKGAFDANARAAVATDVVERFMKYKTVLDQVGLSYGDVVDATLDVPGAIARVNGALSASGAAIQRQLDAARAAQGALAGSSDYDAVAAARDTTRALEGQLAAVDGLMGALNTESEVVSLSREKAAAYTDAVAGLTSAKYEGIEGSYESSVAEAALAQASQDAAAAATANEDAVKAMNKAMEEGAKIVSGYIDPFGALGIAGQANVEMFGKLVPSASAFSLGLENMNQRTKDWIGSVKALSDLGANDAAKLVFEKGPDSLELAQQLINSADLRTEVEGQLEEALSLQGEGGELAARLGLTDALTAAGTAAGTQTAEAIATSIGLSVGQVHKIVDDINKELAFIGVGQKWQLDTNGNMVNGGWIPPAIGFAAGGIGHFGAGTPAMLHGSEAVLPLNDSERSWDIIRAAGLLNAGGGSSGTSIGQMIFNERVDPIEVSAAISWHQGQGRY